MPSGIQIRNQLRLQIRNPVLKLQLPFLKPPKPQLVHPGVSGHARNRLVEVTMFFPEFRDQVDDFTGSVGAEGHLFRIVQVAALRPFLPPKPGARSVSKAISRKIRLIDRMASLVADNP